MIGGYLELNSGELTTDSMGYSSITVNSGILKINGIDDECDEFNTFSFHGGESYIKSFEIELEEISITGGKTIIFIDYISINSFTINGGSFLFGSQSDPSNFYFGCEDYYNIPQKAILHREYLDSGTSIKIYGQDNVELINENAPSDLDFFYFSYQGQTFTLKINGNDVESHIVNKRDCPDYDPSEDDEDDDDDNDDDDDDDDDDNDDDEPDTPVEPTTDSPTVTSDLNTNEQSHTEEEDIFKFLKISNLLILSVILLLF